ncbi:MAG: N-acylneuraminate cytidylyltransferase [Syntrophorhabdus sp. PtaB.Bin006]|nr:MAG: N-acylneuraminate cytidylyltransferase [Syntrophorhabdus sp. PtaB.Bin006]
MYKGKQIVGIIPARGGSKGLRRKNLLPLLDKPLIAWTIEEGKRSKYIDRLILSSEDPEIISVAKVWGCEVPFIRPKELSRDDTPGIEPLLHALNTIPEKYEYAVLLQPTSPLRRASDIDLCIEACLRENAKTCVSIVEASESPYWMYSLSPNNRLTPLISMENIPDCRQALPKAYALNGAVYVAETQWLLANRSLITPETHAYLMPKERSIDIDEEVDFRLAESILKNQNR